MDQELLTYLKQEFGEVRQRFEQVDEQISGLREETRQRFEQVDEQIGGLRGELSSLREETRQRFEQIDEQIRHVHVLVEEGRDETRLLAEGMMGFNHIAERTEKEVNRRLDDLRTLVTPLYRRIDERVAHLEEREGQKTRDVMDLIRERFGKPRNA